MTQCVRSKWVDSGAFADYLERVKQIWRREREAALGDNDFWETELARAYDYGDDPERIPNLEPRLARISAAALRNAARRYLSQGSYVLGVLKPERAAAGASSSGARRTQGVSPE